MVDETTQSGVICITVTKASLRDPNVACWKGLGRCSTRNRVATLCQARRGLVHQGLADTLFIAAGQKSDARGPDRRASARLDIPWPGRVFWKQPTREASPMLKTLLTGQSSPIARPPLLTFAPFRSEARSQRTRAGDTLYVKENADRCRSLGRNPRRDRGRTPD